MQWLQPWLTSVRTAFERRTAQEQFAILAGGGAFLFVVLIGIAFGISGAVSRAEHRLKVKTEQLGEVLQLQGKYRARQAEKNRQLAELSKSGKVRLVALVEDIARQSGVDIGQLRPEEGEATPDGIVESRVDLRASNLTADKLQAFLNRIEQAQGVVVVRRLKVNRPYRRDVVNLELSVTAYRRKES